MSPKGNSEVHVSIGKKLSDAQALAEAGRYTECLAMINQAKKIEQSNVYILAFEKQVEQLISYGEAGILNDEQRTDILESIPGIIERALEGRTPEKKSASQPSVGSLPPEGRLEKTAALEWLKNQYFQHAHEYVRIGEYQHALAEIRRVFIIEQDNRLARDFEKQIEGLAALSDGHRTAPAKTKSPAPAQAPPPSPAPPSPKEELEFVPMLTEEWSSPDATASVPVAQPQSARQEISTLVSSLIIVLTVVIVASSLFYYWTQIHVQRKEVVGRIASPAYSGEVSYSSPTTAEQTFVISTTQKEAGSQSPQVTPDSSAPHTILEPEIAASLPPARSTARQETPVAPKVGAATPRKEEAPQRTQLTSPGTTARPDSQSPPSLAEARNEAPAEPFVAIETEPKIVKLEKPRFPDNAIANGLEGQVIVQVQIDKEGKPAQIKIIKSSNVLLEPAVIDAVNKSQFSPAQMTGGPVAAWMRISFKFALAK